MNKNKITRYVYSHVVHTESVDEMGRIRAADFLHCKIQLQAAVVIGRGL
jgi:hypothetical protein